MSRSLKTAKVTMVPRDSIKMTPECTARTIFDDTLVEALAEAYREGETLAPLTVFDDGEAYWLSDGFHRLKALALVGAAEVGVELRDGGAREAFIFACQVNSQHGRCLTIEEKRAAVRKLLDDPEWGAWNDREIARACGVSHPFVGKLRRAGNVTTSTGMAKELAPLSDAPEPVPSGGPEVDAPPLASGSGAHVEGTASLTTPASVFEKNRCVARLNVADVLGALSGQGEGVLSVTTVRDASGGVTTTWAVERAEIPERGAS